MSTRAARTVASDGIENTACRKRQAMSTARSGHAREGVPRVLDEDLGGVVHCRMAVDRLAAASDHHPPATIGSSRGARALGTHGSYRLPNIAEGRRGQRARVGRVVRARVVDEPRRCAAALVGMLRGKPLDGTQRSLARAAKGIAATTRTKENTARASSDES